MKTYPIRSALFNAAFFFANVIGCLLCLPFLFTPRRFLIPVVRFYLRTIQYLEENILGLKLELRGLENLPKDGSFIIAAKHQSAYETFKLHLLFDHPVIVLKKELLSIPLWGLFLKKTGVIAINRANASSAIESMKSGVMQAKAAGHPIIVFPQGTRRPALTQIDEQPYKTGVARLYEAAENLPIIPVALNTGYFWPKASWLKRPGTAIIEFLPPIPSGQSRSTVMITLKESVEQKSILLAEEAIQTEPQIKSPINMIAILATAFLVYFGVWFTAAQHIKSKWINDTQYFSGIWHGFEKPRTAGFPFRIGLHSKTARWSNIDGSIRIENFKMTRGLMPFSDIIIRGDHIAIENKNWEKRVRFDALGMQMHVRKNAVTVKSARFSKDDFLAKIDGRLNIKQNEAPDFDIRILLENHDDLLGMLVDDEIIEERQRRLLSNAFFVFLRDGDVQLPLTSKDGVLYAGPIWLGPLPEISIESMNQIPPVPQEKP